VNRVLAVSWVALPGNEETIAGLLRTLTEKSRLERGCLAFDVYRSDVDPARFLLLEVYRDDAAFAEHQASDHFQQHVIREAIPLLKSRERVYYHPL
jgi:quinol monooxygenase YgiN